MKVEFLKRVEAEKSSKVKIIMVADMNDPALFDLKRGVAYEVEPESKNKSKDNLTPKEKLEYAQRLISEAMQHLPQIEQPAFDFGPKPSKDTCGKHPCWIRDDAYVEPMGECRLQNGVVTHIADECTVKELRDAKEDKAEGIQPRAEEEVRGDLVGKAQD